MYKEVKVWELALFARLTGHAHKVVKGSGFALLIFLQMAEMLFQESLISLSSSGG
jgi:hypothetical protein